MLPEGPRKRSRKVARFVRVAAEPKDEAELRGALEEATDQKGHMLTPEDLLSLAEAGEEPEPSN
jgi:hypothetical protein